MRQVRLFVNAEALSYEEEKRDDTRGEIVGYGAVGLGTVGIVLFINDIGAFAALAFAQPATYLNRAVELAGDRLTAPQIAAALSRAAGRPVPYAQIPIDVLWEHAPEVAKVMGWANETFYAVDLAPVQAAFPDVMDFASWQAVCVEHRPPDTAGAESMPEQPQDPVP
ncbi:NmrA family NAD(P)-binding protein [Streptomyces canus]|uniref:NmrA family NAD(P)-binding protein n=1 Tax=Streptomyces canus TaxID=58343 RepID=UPI0033B4D36F